MNSDDQIRTSAARVIHAWRLRREMSQSTLAEKVGMHQTAIAKIENGERRIDFSTVVKIADALNIPWDEFNVSAPTEFEVLIQHFSKFVHATREWVAGMMSAYRASERLTQARDDIRTYIVPARVQVKGEITEEGFNQAMDTILELHEKVLETMDSVDALIAPFDPQEKLDNLKNFIEKLEKVNSNAES